VVRQVQEYYCDFFAVNADTFTLNLPNSLALSLPRRMWGMREDAGFERSLQGVLAVMLALKKRPAIRFQGGSDIAQTFARELKARMDAESALFTFRESDAAPVVLVLDRRDDPVTPLLTQWTYQAMVHELMGVKNNRVDLRCAAPV
jgi:vacuolar protein sorting-associated protein 45